MFRAGYASAYDKRGEYAFMEKEKVEQQDTAENTTEETLQDLAQEEVQFDEAGQKVYGLVQEVVDLFKERMGSGELTPYEVAEALAISLSGTIYSVVPPKNQKIVQREAESLTRKTLKTFDQQVQKKNMMFASQLLGAAKVSSYVVSHGNRVLEEYRKGAAQAAEQAKAELEEKMK